MKSEEEGRERGRGGKAHHSTATRYKAAAGLFVSEKVVVPVCPGMSLWMVRKVGREPKFTLRCKL
jgi:hypothetical protein